jgi:hypothetical protein
LVAGCVTHFFSGSMAAGETVRSVGFEADTAAGGLTSRCSKERLAWVAS